MAQRSCRKTYPPEIGRPPVACKAKTERFTIAQNQSLYLKDQLKRFHALVIRVEGPQAQNHIIG